MNEIEEIIRDRVILELEDLKRELKRESERLKIEAKTYREDTIWSIRRHDKAQGLEIAIKRIERKILEKRNR